MDLTLLPARTIPVVSGARGHFARRHGGRHRDVRRHGDRRHGDRPRRAYFVARGFPRGAHHRRVGSIHQKLEPEAAGRRGSPDIPNIPGNLRNLHNRRIR